MNNKTPLLLTLIIALLASFASPAAAGDSLRNVQVYRVGINQWGIDNLNTEHRVRVTVKFTFARDNGKTGSDTGTTIVEPGQTAPVTSTSEIVSVVIVSAQLLPLR